MLASNKAGLSDRLSPETAWLLNREAIARRYGCSPVEVESWPAYERDAALEMMSIEAEAERRRPKKRR